MQAESRSESWDFDVFMAWLYANRVSVTIGTVVVVVVIGGVSIFNWQKAEKNTKANTALFALPALVGATPTNNIRAEDYEKVAQEFPDTPAGERAELLAAGILFTDGKYPEAQQQFSKFLSAHEDSPLRSQAALGVAASLEAQGKTTDAIAKYQELISQYSGQNVVAPAKLTLARLLESQNKPADALKLYEDLTRIQNPYDPWAAEASERREQLLQKNPTLRASPTTTLSAPMSNPAVAPASVPKASSTNIPKK